MEPAPPAIDAASLVRGEHYATHGYPHETWARLRRESPVHRCEVAGFDPFWAITRYHDLAAVSRQPRLFLNAPRLSIFPRSFPRRRPEETARALLNMDPPEHGKYRGIVNRSFTPHGLRPLQVHVEELSAAIVDELARSVVGRAARDGECDFVTAIAARLPLAVIMELLGVPHDDWELLFQWSNEAIGPGDPEYRGDREPFETAERARLALFEYFSRYVAERRRAPREDLVSVLVRSRIDDRPLEDFDILSYCFLLAVAGNETTRNATTGGMLALIENPSEMARLRADPSLLDSAVEEILRWTS
ncbi:MAG: cytochrome P450, partial [Candidatus Binatia bacterium]